MSLFVIDREKCDRDGACAAECPLGIIQMKGRQSFPAPTEDADQLCIRCGHCVAVCPNGALSHAAMPLATCPPIHQEWAPDAKQAEHFLRARRSIRNYRNRTVHRESLQQLIEVARYAPSGHNCQPVEWLVVYDTDRLKALTAHVIDWMRDMLEKQPAFASGLHMDRVVASWEAGHDRVCRSAPHLIAAHAARDDRAAPVAGTIALTYLDLAAPSFGLGTCWAGYFNVAANLWPPLWQALQLPAGHVTLGAMLIGYPRYPYYRLPTRNDPPIIWQ